MTLQATYCYFNQLCTCKVQAGGGSGSHNGSSTLASGPGSPSLLQVLLKPTFIPFAKFSLIDIVVYLAKGKTTASLYSVQTSNITLQPFIIIHSEMHFLKFINPESFILIVRIAGLRQEQILIYSLNSLELNQIEYCFLGL